MNWSLYENFEGSELWVNKLSIEGKMMGREIHFLVTQVKSFMFFQNENIELNQNATVSSQFNTTQLYKSET